jgi:hypothetical protein
LTIEEFLNSLPAGERERMLGRLEGLSLAMRICRNRAVDLSETGQPLSPAEASEICASTIRFVQVQIGAGGAGWQELIQLTREESMELWRIWQ